VEDLGFVSRLSIAIGSCEQSYGGIQGNHDVWYEENDDLVSSKYLNAMRCVRSLRTSECYYEAQAREALVPLCTPQASFLLAMHTYVRA
jgi:hypothetical protein